MSIQAKKDQTFELALDEILSQIGITNKRLAKMTGLQASQISRLKNGTSRIDFLTLATLSAALDLPIELLFRVVPRR